MRKAPLTVCVVGGGFTGAAAAIACLSRLDRPFRFVVVEPSASLGRGVAYGAHHPLHLLNVRTCDLSVRAGQPDDFLNWAFRQLDQGEMPRMQVAHRRHEADAQSVAAPLADLLAHLRNR